MFNPISYLVNKLLLLSEGGFVEIFSNLIIEIMSRSNPDIRGKL